MKILFYLTRYPGVGGIENVTTMIAESLAKTSSIDVVSHVQQDDMQVPSFVQLHKMPDAGQWFTQANYVFADHLVRDNEYDIIIYQDSYAPTEKIVCEVAVKYQVRLLVFEHNSPLFIYNKRDLDPITTPKGLIRHLLHPYLLHQEVKRKRYLLNHSKRYILLSKTFIPDFCKLISVDENDERITYINNPITSSESSSIEKENTILCVSRLTKEKCVDKMICIWSNIAGELPDCKFQIVGDGPERSRLEAIVRNNNVPRVEFVGFAKPNEYYRKAKIFWMTSKYEGWGMTLVEAMQHGCVPIAYHSFSSLNDIIDNEVNGVIVPNNNVQLFASKTISIINNKNIFKTLSNQAIQKTMKFNLNYVVQAWEKIINYE